MGRKNKKPKWLQRIKQRILRYSFYAFAAFLGITLLFRVVPVPFSSYMAQQKVSHLLNGESYPIKYQWVSLDNISWQMQLAVIAAEDQKFSQHHGIDWDAIDKALKYNKKSTKVRGGSTISQQTVKNLYLWHGQSWLRKGIELPTTLMVELLWSKKRILEVYLNIAEFGNGIFGVEAASQAYFKKSAKQLNQQEAALLAAVLPNPIIFKANKPSAFVQKKQRWIMRQMNALGKGYLTQLN
ncbi:monofunctional biosynthetic peptidoglycan transglycosylase [Avibacterium avium]|uniref:monofunctional biosynthetic peptidoglycan transglycosylase n=1 Tax=Avibacterium avium TaxID=751 RepID=UPI003BF8965C